MQRSSFFIGTQCRSYSLQFRDHLVCLFVTNGIAKMNRQFGQQIGG